MTQHEILNNIDHQDFRVITDMHPNLGGMQSYATLVMSELEAAQSAFPLFFRQQSDKKNYEIVAVLGLAEQENLFLDDAGWHGHYLPLSIKRQPFLIGFQQQPQGVEPVVCIDRQSPRIDKTRGEALFLPHGGQSGFLQEVASILMTLHEGHQQVADFISAITALDLIEPVAVDISLNNGERLNLEALATINEDKLQGLPADALQQLHHAGWLKAIYMMIASLGNLSRVIERKNAQL